MSETQDSSVSRDLLQRFTCGGGGNLFPVKPKDETLGTPEKLELSLGLSLNGRFGVKPQKVLTNDDKNDNKLSRASSVIDFVNYPVDIELSLYSPITRTCSLPPETDVEWRKRKELQSLRRSEAKRKRVEKLKNVRVVKGKNDGSELWRSDLKQSPPSQPPPPPVQFSSQGSIGSQGSGGSSGVSDLDSQPFQGINKDTSEAKGCSESNKVQCSPKVKRDVHCAIDQTMPCVSTKGGPDGKKIQGFLYRYGKGEEVRIVCVCHGSFLTPVEFVKHGGGGDVENPLKHIVMTSSLFS